MPARDSSNPASPTNPNDLITPEFVDALTDDTLERILILSGVSRVQEILESIVDGLDDEEDADWLDDDSD